jgi:rhodanese-related sulfurtransferase
MTFTLTAICIMVLFACAAVLMKRARDRSELATHSITPEALYALLASNGDVVIFDVRQPLDLLGDSVIIPGAKWFAPQAVLDDPSLISENKELVVYCTCPSDKTSLVVVRRALAMGFSQIRLLRGGLDGWRAKGYPVEPYEKPFHLDSGQNKHLARTGGRISAKWHSEKGNVRVQRKR